MLGELSDERLGEDKDYVFIENCENMAMNLSGLKRHKIGHFHLINLTNVDIVVSSESLNMIENLVIFQSTVYGM